MFLNPKKQSQLLFLLSLATFAFWAIIHSINVYRFISGGAIYELLSVPMAALLPVIPVMSIILMKKYKTGLNSLFFYSILVIAITIVMLFFISYRN